MNYKPMNGVGYQKMTDRDRVNLETKHNPRPCLPVSIEFFEEMLECVPPAFFGTTTQAGHYSAMQVGEAMDHDQNGERYETFMRMNQSSIDAGLADSRMEAGQWYFTGLHNLLKND